MSSAQHRRETCCGAWRPGMPPSQALMLAARLLLCRRDGLGPREIELEIGGADLRPAPRGQAARGGPWLCRTRPSGLLAVVVPSVFRVMVQPHRWIRIRWWNEQRSRQLPRLVVPPWLRGMMWWTWQAAGGVSQPGAAQCRSLVMIARRRCGGTISVTVPTSRGRLIDPAGRAGFRSAARMRARRARTAGRRLAQDDLRGRRPWTVPAAARACHASSSSPPCLVGSSPACQVAAGSYWAQYPASRPARWSRRSWWTRPVRRGARAASQSSPGPAHGPGSTGAGPAGARPDHGRRALAGRVPRRSRGAARARPGVPMPCRYWSRDRCSCSWTGCPARPGRHPAPISRRAGFFQGVVVALRPGPGVLGPLFLPQAVQHVLQGGGAPGRQVTGQPARAAEGGVQVAGRGRRTRPRVLCPDRRSGGGSPPTSSASAGQVHRLPPRRRAGSRPRPAGAPAGSLSVQSVTCRAYDTDTAPSASASAIAG